MNTRSAISALLLTGCGDSLISGENLESLLGLTPLPLEPAWEVRWYAGSDSVLVVGCQLLPTELEPGDLYWENLYGDPPDIETPLVWVGDEDDEYRYAIALLILVDAERYLGIDELEDEEGESLNFWRGVWGGVADRALLFAQGDLEVMAEDALLLPDALEIAEEEAIWLGLLPELAAVKEDLAGALYPLPEEDEDSLFEFGLEITQTEHLSEASHEVLSGEILGEGVIAGCEE